MNIEYFIKKQNRILNKTPISFVRREYLDFLNQPDKLIGLIGARGVGKTTLLLKYLKDKKNYLYIIADDIVFQNRSIYEIVDEFYMYGGRIVVIDEIHKYPNWARELKNIYDSFDITIRFSGSSQLNILYEKYDLSRRVVIKIVSTLSFREYLELRYNLKLQKYTLSEILENSINISNNLVGKYEYLYSEFKNYLKYGNYPFFIENTETFKNKLFNAIEKIINEDIPSLNKIDFNHLAVFKKIIFKLIEANKPYQVNISAMAREFKISEPTLYIYLDILEKSDIVKSLKKYSTKISKKPNKLLFKNTNIYETYADEFSLETDIGTIRETFFVSNFDTIFYSDVGDFRVEEYTFEIGGKNKSFKQIQNIKNSYVVADTDISVMPHKIPLWLFGFLY